MLVDSSSLPSDTSTAATPSINVIPDHSPASLDTFRGHTDKQWGILDFSDVKSLPNAASRVVVYNTSTLATVLELSKHPTIQDLEFMGCEALTEEALEHIAAMPRLTRLCLNSDSRPDVVTDAGLATLARSRSLQSLECHSLGRITDMGFSRLEECGTVLSIEIAYCPDVTADVLHSISSIQSLVSLELQWSYCAHPVFTEGLLFNLSRLYQLQRLTIGGGEIPIGTSFDALGTLTNMQDLQFLHMRGVSDSLGLTLAKMPNLKRLSLSGCSNVSVGILQNMEGHVFLDYLNAKGTQIVPDDIESFSVVRIENASFN